MTDIKLMNRVADSLSKKPEIKTKRNDENAVRPVKTTKLSDRFDLSIPVMQSLREIQIEEEEEYSPMGRRM